VEFRRDHATGLLAQAKLGRRTKGPAGGYSWDSLTDSQERLFPKRRDYYSLLLYRLKGQKADSLEAFGWQICRKYSVREVKKWLRSDAFPEEVLSANVLGKLFARAIGTEDPKIIQTIIDPKTSDVRSIDIRVFWPDGGGPSPSMQLRQTKQEMHVQIRH
jgi:hypothetical protein